MRDYMRNPFEVARRSTQVSDAIRNVISEYVIKEIDSMDNIMLSEILPTGYIDPNAKVEFDSNTHLEIAVLTDDVAKAKNISLEEASSMMNKLFEPELQESVAQWRNTYINQPSQDTNDDIKLDLDGLTENNHEL